MSRAMHEATELRLPELPARYNAAETFIDAHRGVREDALAIRCQGKSVSYGELAASVDRCGNALRALGVGMEQRVVILCLDSPEFVYAFFGAIKIGAIPVPANTLLTPHDLAYILQDSRAVAVVVSSALVEKVLEARKGYRTSGTCSSRAVTRRPARHRSPTR